MVECLLQRRLVRTDHGTHAAAPTHHSIHLRHPPVIVQHPRPKRTGFHTQATKTAQPLVHPHPRQLLPSPRRQKHRRPQSRPLRLYDRLLQKSRTVSQSCYIEAVPIQIQRLHLGLLLLKKASLVQFQAQYPGQPFLLVRLNAHAQDHQVGLQLQRQPRHRLFQPDAQPSRLSFYLRLAPQFVAHKDNSRLPRRLVIRLPKTKGPHLPVQDIHLHLGPLRLQFQCVLDRLRAAHPRTVGPPRLPRTHALHHDYRPHPGQRPLGQLLLQFALRYHPWVSPVQVLLRRRWPTSRGDDDHPHLDPLLPLRAEQHRPVPTRPALQPPQLGLQPQPNPLLRPNTRHQIPQRPLRV